MWEDGSKFQGLWKANERWKGEMKMEDGTKYIGSFKGDKFHGKARLVFGFTDRSGE